MNFKKINKLKLINNIKLRVLNLQLILISSVILTIYRFLREIKKGILESSPNTLEIIPPIQYIRGFLENDLLAKSLANSPALRTANLLNFILPEDNINLLATFISLDKILFGITISLIIFLISNFVILLLNHKKEFVDYKNKIYWNLYFLISASVIALSIKVFKNLNYKSILYITTFGWGYPPNYGLNASGISILFIIIAILLPILLSNKFISSDFRNKKIIFAICLLSYSLSVYFHPQLPLGIFTILVPIRLFFLEKNQNRNYWNKIILSYLAIWVINAIIINQSFSGTTLISNNEFFRIYVESRLFGHYLPSFYFNKETVVNLLFNIFTIFLLFILLKFFKLDKKNILLKLFFTGISLAFLLTLVQYIFVEVLKNPLFIKIGFSRFTYSYGFFYISCIVYSFCSIANLFFESFSRKISQNFIKINFKSDIFILILSSILIVQFFSIIFSRYEKYIEFLNNSPVITLKETLRDNEIQSKNIIFLDSTEKLFFWPRLIGNISIYHDRILPFNTDGMIKWDERRTELINLRLCRMENVKENCFKNFYNKDVIFISESEIKNFNLLSKIDVGNKQIYLYGNYDAI